MWIVQPNIRMCCIFRTIYLFVAGIMHSIMYEACTNMFVKSCSMR